jgi:hypothetical protein
MVLSRRTGAGPDVDQPAAPVGEPGRRWTAVLTWVLLGGAIAGLWTLLLVGDSLR